MHSRQWPIDPIVLALFLAVVLVGGTNFVAVRFTNRELGPFIGAAARFVIAAWVLLAIVGALRIPIPRGRALAGAAVFGVLNMGLSQALGYWGLVEAPAALGAAFTALVPLLTFAIAVALRMERFRWQGAFGGGLGAAGVAIVFADRIEGTVSAASVLALFGMAVAIAAGTVLAKRLPRAHPVGMTAVAVPSGAVLLLALSWAGGEPLRMPTQAVTWIALVWLSASTVAVFAAILYIVRRWTASATSYTTVLFPVVTVPLGTVLAGEVVSATFILGAALVMAGTYFGVLSQPARVPAPTPMPSSASAPSR